MPIKYQLDVLMPCRCLVICGHFRALAALSVDSRPWYTILNINQNNYWHTASSYPPSFPFSGHRFFPLPTSTWTTQSHSSGLRYLFLYIFRDPKMSTGYRDCRCLVEGYDQCLCKFCNRCGGLGHTVLYCKRKSHGGRSGGYMSFSRPTKSTPMNDLDQIDNHREVCTLSF